MNILLASHVACHVALILRFAQEDLKIYFWGKFHLVLGILARVIAIQSYFSHTPFVQAWNPLENLYIWKYIIATQMLKLRVHRGTR